MAAWISGSSCKRFATLSLVVVPMALAAQSTAVPAKAGLWETKITTTQVIQLPPEVAARLAALPPEQQAMMRANMPGGGQPIVTTTQSCSTGQDSMDTLLSRAQSSAMKCTFPNRMQTADGASFDISCTSDNGSAKGHMEFHRADAEHVSGTTHMEITGTARGRTMNTTADSTTSARWVSADCGSVKPGASAVVKTP